MDRGVVALAALLVLASGCVGASPEEPAPSMEEDAAPHVNELKFDGAFLLPADTPAEHAFRVAAGVERIEAVLSWSPTTSSLSMRIVDDEGTEIGSGFPEDDGRASVSARWPPGVGGGKVIVSPSTAVNAAYDLSLRLVENADRYGPIDLVYELGPGAGAEINFDMAAEDYFDYEWSSNAIVYFDLHWHRDGTTYTEVQRRGTSMAGSFTAPETEIYSLFWINEGVQTVRVTVAVDGIYQLHSMHQP